MASPLKCDICDKPATVHLTQILNNQAHKVDLCEDCARAKGITDAGDFSLADLLIKASLNPEPTVQGACEQCGFTQSDFKKTGRFGCPACYDAFRGLLEPMLDGMHKGVVHKGKVPRLALERRSLHERLAKLELDLSDAVKSERFEEAARFRDEINQVRQATDRKTP
jgi:protein arginine kinase activator